MPVDLSILGLLIFLLEFLIQSSRRNAPPHNRQSPLHDRRITIKIRGMIHLIHYHSTNIYPLCKQAVQLPMYNMFRTPHGKTLYLVPECCVTEMK